MPLSREMCRICRRANPVGFHVPDSVWLSVVPSDLRESVLCISCFTRIADEKVVPWDREIELFPVSMASHLEFLAD